MASNGSMERNLDRIFTRRLVSGGWELRARYVPGMQCTPAPTPGDTFRQGIPRTTLDTIGRAGGDG